jgi:hypothetical protein
LAIGVPGNQAFDLSIGAVHVMFGTASGLTDSFDELIYDPANPEVSDRFGRTVSAGDFNGDGFTDLAVGASRDDPVGVEVDDSGSVFVHYSDASGTSQSNYQNWYPGHLGLKGSPAEDDYFGSALPGSGYRP